jgi:hypothetical protein
LKNVLFDSSLSVTGQHTVSSIPTLANMLILSGHQPTLFPYAGFFYKMYHSNVMDICPYDPFSRHSDRYERRVKIGNDDNWRWLALPVDEFNGCSIMDVKLKTDLMGERWQELEKCYGEYPLWNDYRNALKEIFFGYRYLWELNLRFILWVRDLLGIKTYLSISYEGKGCDTTERIAFQFKNYGSVIYLAGKCSAQYLDMQKYERLTQSTIALVTYTPPRPFSSVSILTPLLLYPPERVLDILNIKPEPIQVVINDSEYFIELCK